MIKSEICLKIYKFLLFDFYVYLRKITKNQSDGTISRSNNCVHVDRIMSSCDGA